jgi:hypothetical protein
MSVDIYQVVLMRHDIFGMPALARRRDETSIIVLPAIVSPVTFAHRAI